MAKSGPSFDVYSNYFDGSIRNSDAQIMISDVK